MSININAAFDLLEFTQRAQDAWPFTTALLILMVLDFITGIAAAIGTRTLSSNISWRGICKKVVTWCVIAAISVVDRIVPGNLPIFEITCLGFIGTELISILENANKLGIVPAAPVREAAQKLAQTSGHDLSSFAGGRRGYDRKVPIQGKPDESRSRHP